LANTQENAEREEKNRERLALPDVKVYYNDMEIKIV
jgi:hypothetical protein